jgi:serine/threonine protein kinase
LLPHLAEDASFIKAFVREAKLASLLTHVNIVQIYELGRVGTEYFISMEYIDGRDVRRILRHARKVTGPPPIHVTVGLLLQLCEALDYAHNKADDDGSPLGLVHRDVSPSNLLVTSSGHLKVIDFGIAKAQSSQLRTQTGRVKGKLAYMAPEAVSGSRELDARSDVWAVGVILHELLTARPLFASKNEYQTLLKVQRGDIMPPSTFNQACPPELDAIVFKALARDPDDRFSGASELRDELLHVRRAYQLHTGVRDVAQWLDWAFALEVPAGFSGNTLEPSQVSPAARAVRRNRDDDDAVEMVWGTGDGDVEASGPVVLDDVPDVSAKHLAARGDAAGADDDISDDIPTPQPSHGSRSSRPSQSPRGSDPGMPPRPDPAIARGTDPPRRPQRSTAPGIAPVRSSDRISAQRLDAPSMSERLAAQRARDSEPPPLPHARLPSADNVRTDPDGFPMIDRERGATDPVGRAVTPPPVLAVDDLFPGDLDQARTLDGSDGPADTMLEMAAEREPVVRFSTSKRMRAVNADGGLASLRPPPRTKPGVQPAARPKQPPAIAPATQKPVIGASMVERNKPARRGWLLVLGLLLIAGGAAAVAMYAMTGNDSPTKRAEPPPAPSHDPGTVKFVTEPADSDVLVEGQTHTGSPWSLELPPGPHQIEIHHSGYKAWLTSIELAPKETQTFRVVLEPLGKGTSQTDATLSLTTTPPDLEAVLDGQPLSQHTPIKIPIKVGPHVVVVRKDNVELWRQTITAEASSVYELNPILTDDKPHGHPAPPAPGRPMRRPVVEAPEPEKVEKPDKVEPPPAPAPEVKAEVPPPAPLPVPTPVTPPPPTPTPPPAPPPAPSHTAPVTVAPNAVTKLSGSLPNIAKFSKTELPAVAAAKLCIDVNGAVTSVDFITKLEKHAATDLGDALRTWRYTPYREKGIAFSACFVVTLRMK